MINFKKYQDILDDINIALERFQTLWKYAKMADGLEQYILLEIARDYAAICDEKMEELGAIKLKADLENKIEISL